MPSKRPGPPKNTPKSPPPPPPAPPKGGPGWSLLLYPLAVAGGLYVGTEAYPPLKDRLRDLYADTRVARAVETPEPPSEPRKRTRRKRPRRQSEVRPAGARPDGSRDSTPAEPAESRGNSGSSSTGEPSARTRDSKVSREQQDRRNSGGAAVPDSQPPAETPQVEVRPAEPLQGTSKAAEPAPEPGPKRLQGSGPQPVSPREVDRGAGRRREVSLTFDAGSDYRPVPEILEALSQEGVKATFFLTGEWVRRNPLTTRRIVAEGHELGNHSWNHPPFTSLTDDEIRDQLRRTETMIEQTAGRSSLPYFRPPLGARDRRVLGIIGSEGYYSVYWTLDSRDSVDRGITPDQIRERVVKGVQPGSIVLMHCGSQATADALPEILRGLRQKGLAQVPVGRLLTE